MTVVVVGWCFQSTWLTGEGVSLYPVRHAPSAVRRRADTMLAVSGLGNHSDAPATCGLNGALDLPEHRRAVAVFIAPVSLRGRPFTPLLCLGVQFMVSCACPCSSLLFSPPPLSVAPSFTLLLCSPYSVRSAICGSSPLSL